MRLDKGGEGTTIAELLERFVGRSWLYELGDLHPEPRREAEAAGAVRFYEGGLTTGEPVETGDGPYVVIVDGDLVTPGHVALETDDYLPGRVIVTGSLCAGSLSFANGARVVVEGQADIARVCVGQWGDRDGVFDVHGELSVPLLVLDRNSFVGAGKGFRGLIYSCSPVGAVEPDIESDDPGDDLFFPAELLDDEDFLDLDKLIKAGRDEGPLLLPGIAESFPDRLRLRKTG
jgi:hypothetical protein